MKKYSNLINSFDVKNLKYDILVGIVIALVSIPISMGYALVAGLPVVYGLYGSLLPILFYAFITSSPRYMFGVDAAPAALTGGILASMSIVSESGMAKDIIPVITFVTAFWLLVFYLFRADRLIKFISAPVMGGFITGIGMTIILMQIPKLFGGNSGRGELIVLVVHIIKEARNGFNVLSMIMGVSTVVIILIFRKIAPKVPMAAVMMFVGALITYFFHVENYGVKLLPEVEPGLPKLVIPDFSLLYGRLRTVVLPCLTIAVVIFSETLLATQNFGLKHGDKINNRREILAYSVGNFVAAFLGCCPVNGSVSRTGMADQYGVRSQVSSIVAGIGMGFVLMFGTGFIKLLPVPVLTAIVISALIGTFEFDLAHKLKKTDKTEFMIFYVAFFVVLVFGTVYGVLVGIILSAATFIGRAARPHTDFLGCIPGDSEFYSLERNKLAKPIKNTVIYSFSGALFYANINQFQDELDDSVREDTTCVIVDASGIGSVDVTAAERIMIIYENFKKKGIRFFFAGHSGKINDELRLYGAEKLIYDGAVASRIDRALSLIGMNEPYPLEEKPEYTEESKLMAAGWRNSGIKHIAEFEWAFGDSANEKLEDLAEQIALDIIRSSDYNFDNILETEKASSLGYWSKIDEDEFLYLLEQQIMIHLAEGEEIVDREALQEKLIKRHIYLEEILEGRGEDVLRQVIKERERRDAYFEANNPEAYKLLLVEREKYKKYLKENNPELLKRIEKIKNVT